MIDKFELMREIAGSFNSTYQATLWLKTEEKYLGSSPAQAIKQGRIEETFSALKGKPKKK